MEQEIIRITDDLLPADFQDGDVLTHTDINKIITVLKTAINQNYVDMTDTDNNLDVVKQQLGDTWVSKYADTTLLNSDDVFPSSRQVINYINPNTISEVLKLLPGYNGSTTQVLKNINGVLTWVTEV